MYSSASRTDIQPWGWRRRVRRLHLRHLWFLRLNDWTLECTRCGATKEDTRVDRDTLERLIWTVVAAALAEVPIALADLDQWWVLPVIAAVNWILIQVRKRTGLPSPGEGLPGLPT